MKLNTDDIRPIRFGTAKLLGFLLILCSVSGYLAWIDQTTAAAVAGFILLQSVKIVSPNGWQSWLREWFRRNFIGYEVRFKLNPEDDKLEWEFDPNWRYSPSPYRRYSQEYISLHVRLSGWWRSNDKMIYMGNSIGEEWWYVKAFRFSDSRSRFFGWQSPPEVVLAQEDGSCVRLSMADALRLLRDQTVIDEKGNIKSVGRLGDLIKSNKKLSIAALQG